MSIVADVLPMLGPPEPVVFAGGETVMVSAKKGGGKSRRCVDFICDELLESDRLIITNLPIHVGAFCDWAYENYPDKAIDVAARLRRVTDAEIFRFYLHTKKVGERLTLVPDATGNPDVMVPMLQSRSGDGGILFIFDEIQNFYRTRNWKSVGPEVDFYLSQSRKLNDVLITVTQDPDKVSVDFRRNATRWVYVENLHKRRMLLGVTLPGWFHWGAYIDQPRRGEQPDEQGYFQLKYQDRHKLYDTMAGVGLSGKVKPDVSGVHGLHWATWPVAFCLVLVGAWLFVPTLAKTVNIAVGHFAKKMSSSVNSALASMQHRGVVRQVASTALGRSAGINQPRLLSEPGTGSGGTTTGSPVLSPDSDQIPVFCTGYSVLAGRATAFLSDGSVVDDREGLQRLSLTAVEIKGVSIPVLHQRPEYRPEAEHSLVQNGTTVVGDIFLHRQGTISVSIIGQRAVAHQPSRAYDGRGGNRSADLASGTQPAFEQP
jgi:hypothetical protein